MKRSLAILLTAALAFGLLGAPSAFAKKKKKPVTKTFTAEGTMLIPGPTSLVIAGITESEFRETCSGAEPTTQGVDGWVVALPTEFQSGYALLEVAGSDTTTQYDMDVYFYDSACGLMEPYMVDGVNPAGAIPAGAAYAVVDLFIGANASFDLKATVTL